jgi:hypothetical protein
MNAAALNTGVLAALAFVLMSAEGHVAAADSHAAMQPPAQEMMEAERTEERLQMQRLRRARAQHEAERAEAVRRREAEQARQMEIHRLQSDLLHLERRESTLSHDTRQLQRELQLLPRDASDHAAAARRGELERNLFDQQLQLHRTTTSRDDAMRRLEQFRIR